MGVASSCSSLIPLLLKHSKSLSLALLSLGPHNSKLTCSATHSIEFKFAPFRANPTGFETLSGNLFTIRYAIVAQVKQL